MTSHECIVVSYARFQEWRERRQRVAAELTRLKAAHTIEGQLACASDDAGPEAPVDGVKGEPWAVDVRVLRHGQCHGRTGEHPYEVVRDTGESHTDCDADCEPCGRSDDDFDRR